MSFLITKCSILSVLLLLCSSMAQAIGVGDLTTEIPHNKTFVAKKITNPGAIGKFVMTRVERVSDPIGLKAVKELEPTVLVSPATQLVGADKSGEVKVYYQGPNDDQERYYQLIFTEQNMNRPSQLDGNKEVDVKRRVSISTILVVRPRTMRFAQQNDGKGWIKNTGNTYFQVLGMGQCNKKTESKKESHCTTSIFLMPGEEYHFNKVVDVFESYGIWIEDRYQLIRAK